MILNPAALATIRGLSGYSQAELARQSGISQGHISQMEKGDKNASPKTIKRLAETLRVPIAALVSVAA